ncbi:MAG TPA: hypothetical protein VE439_05910 [Anaerolineae bacterium]|nr:hypothetical protein [Anaerolineae bacterium]
MHQVHPLIAKVWSQRLSDYIVIAANEDFIPGKVSFSVRTATGINLLDFLAEFKVEGEEIGYGHEAAAGGVVTKAQFAKLLRRLGFPEELKASA